MRAGSTAGVRRRRLLAERAPRGAVHANVGDVVHPVKALGVQVVDSIERASREKVVFDVIHESFDFPFRSRTNVAMRLDREAVMLGKVGEGFVRSPGPIRTCFMLSYKIGLRPATKVSERFLMTLDQLRRLHRRGELDKGHSRPGRTMTKAYTLIGLPSGPGNLPQ